MLEQKLESREEREIKLFLQDIEEYYGIILETTIDDIIDYLGNNFREDVHDLVTKYGHFALPYSIDTDIIRARQRFNKQRGY